jgi:DNA invertase Pin-like site-specific DNA recombinase
MQVPENCVGYVRVSTNEQTTVNQIDILKRAGVKVFFADEGVSGMKDPIERAEYRAMIRYLKEHPGVKTIVIYELSRLGRNMQKSINTFLDLEKEGYTIWSLTEEWTHSSEPGMRSLMLTIISWVNEQERNRISSRTKAGMDRVRKYGSKSGRPIGRQRKDPDEATVKTLRDSKMSWHKIADQLGMEISTLYRYRMIWKHKELGRGLS